MIVLVDSIDDGDGVFSYEVPLELISLGGMDRLVVSRVILCTEHERLVPREGLLFDFTDGRGIPRGLIVARSENE